jgi:dGTPase
MIRMLIDRLVVDLAEATARALAATAPASPDAVRRQPESLVRYSAETGPLQRKLKEFLYDELYQHPRVLAVTRQAEQILGDLYRAYRRQPHALPPHVRARFDEDGEARAIADYIAGMTDRFAQAEHEKLGRDV